MAQVIAYSSPDFQGTAQPLSPGANPTLSAASIQIPAGFLVSLTDGSGQTKLCADDQRTLSGPFTNVVVTQLDNAIPQGALDKLKTFVEQGLTFDFFTVRNTSNFKLDAALQVQVAPSSVTLSGRVTLGAPFQAAFTVTITVSLVDKSFKVALQLNSLANLFNQGLVGLSASFKAKVSDVVMPYVQVLQGARFEFTASASGDLSVDLYASLPLIKLPPLSLINQQFPHFQLSNYVRPLDLHIGCSAGTVLAFTVDASVSVPAIVGYH